MRHSLRASGLDRCFLTHYVYLSNSLSLYLSFVLIEKLKSIAKKSQLVQRELHGVSYLILSLWFMWLLLFVMKNISDKNCMASRGTYSDVISFSLGGRVKIMWTSEKKFFVFLNRIISFFNTLINADRDTLQKIINLFMSKSY